MSLIGKRLGNYDIQGKLGEGGMGIVYMGVHPQIGKKVAVKVLHPELSDKADVVTRFFNEAKAVNDINHPNIVDIIDFGEATVDGTTFKYIMMEFLDGESLSARMRREGVTIRESVSILAQCCSALAASHAKGVVHRDLKPENIFLVNRPSDRNYVKLLDFGIAKLTTEDGAMSQKTRTGMVIGTPTYMSPEQCDGKGNIDHRADIYALGVVMYELLTGKVPFPGEGFGEVLVAHLTREPDAPRSINPNIPPEIEAIILRCLKKRKEDRFQSMNDMLAAMSDPGPHYQAWLAGRPAPQVSGPVNVPTPPPTAPMPRTISTTPPRNRPEVPRFLGSSSVLSPPPLLFFFFSASGSSSSEAGREVVLLLVVFVGWLVCAGPPVTHSGLFSAFWSSSCAFFRRSALFCSLTRKSSRYCLTRAQSFSSQASWPMLKAKMCLSGANE